MRSVYGDAAQAEARDPLAGSKRAVCRVAPVAVLAGCVRLPAAMARCHVRRRIGLPLGERGQGTVEFALVTAGLLTVIVACGALWRVFEGGLFVEHALMAASHHVQGAAPGSIADVFLY